MGDEKEVEDKIRMVVEENVAQQLAQLLLVLKEATQETGWGGSDIIPGSGK